MRYPRYLSVVLTGLSLSCALALAQNAPTAVAAGNANAPAAAAALPGPSEVVQEAAQGMLGDLDRDRDLYRREPARVGQLVDKYLLPHFDTAYSARLVLGQYWRKATPEQQQHFVAAFRKSLVNNYGSSLVDFTADRLKIFPTKPADGASTASVRTQVKRASGEPVDVNYSLHKTAQGWKAWDVKIDGISYVKSYHDDFGPQIEQQGLEAVIKRLEAGEAPPGVKKGKG